MAEEPTYGLSLNERLRTRSDGAIQLHSGALYRRLAALAEDGMLEPVEEDTPSTEGGAPRKVYRTTEKGREALRAEALRQAAMLEAARALDLAPACSAESVATKPLSPEAVPSESPRPDSPAAESGSAAESGREDVGGTPETSRPHLNTAVFDAMSHLYDLPVVQWLAYRPIHNALLQSLGGGSTQRILDVGCGTGQLTTRIRQALPRAELVGCDVSPAMLQRAADRDDQIEWVHADASSLPFPDQSFDTVVSTEAFHWFPDQEVAMAECFRVLRPGGRILVALVNAPLSLVGDVALASSRLAGQPFYWPTMAEMRENARAAGFRVIEQRRILRLNSLFLPPVLTVAARPA